MTTESLVACFNDTIERSQTGELKEFTERAISSNFLYRENFSSLDCGRQNYADSATEKILVVPDSTFAAAQKNIRYGKTAVLNFANPQYPGGGASKGAVAQEECLCRCSNLYLCLSAPNIFEDYYFYHKKYTNHLFSDRIIYTKDVVVFKDESEVPALLPRDEWFFVDVITCAAPYIAKINIDNALLKSLFKSRIKNIFEAAIDNKVEVIILGAFGCGAFKNPPEVVAEAFHEVIDENGYADNFKKIVFAIKCNPNNTKNLDVFQEEFSKDEEKSACVELPWLDDLRERVENNHEEFENYLDWKKSNKYYKKRFSILGDSISTLAGCNPKGYKVFYADENCEKSAVKEMQDTWWGKVIDFFGGELLVNNSWSGSRVTKLPDKYYSSDNLFPSGCSNERTGGLHINGVKPDVIIVYLGTNDWANGIPTLEYWENSGDYENWLGTKLLPNEECFDVAYDQMLTKLSSNYPNAEIWCCTLCGTYISKHPDFKFPHKYAGTHIEEYNEIIRDVAERNGCRLIDLYDYKIAYDSIDGSHPTNAGMNTIATMVIREMIGQKVDSFLDCENAEHDYIINEEYTGGTKYVCVKCGKVKHTTTLLPPQEVTMEAKMMPNKDHELSKYIWGDKRIDRIKSISLSWGDLPIYHIDIEYDTVSLYRRINGSRDGWMTFPDGYFDEKKKSLVPEEKRRLFQFFETVDFTKWTTDEKTMFNIENMVCGFCVKESFSCIFDDDTTFYCATPPQKQFDELVDYFKNFFPGENMEPFHDNVAPIDEETVVLGGSNGTETSEYVMQDPNITTILYSDILRLTIVSSGKTVQFQKDIVEVGRDQASDLLLDGKTTVARRQATFLYEKNMWFLRDNFSTNGTWLNGTKIQPGKKYQLATNDEVNFAMAERIIFDKHENNTQPTGDPDAKTLAFLEAGMATFAKSDHKDEVSLKLIIAALSDVPLYFPVEIDLEAMLGSVDPTKLKAGDTLQPTKDVKMRILTLTPESGVEFVPMFTSNEEVNKGPSASIIRFYPQDYLPKLIQMDKPIIINPFSENRFLLSKQLITEVLLPLVENKKKPQSDVIEQPADKYNGKTIDGKYEVLKLIGRGGAFDTYLATDMRLNLMWVVKVSRSNRTDDTELIQNQINILKQLDHPMIPRFANAYMTNGKAIIVQEYVAGTTLEDIVNEYGGQSVEHVVDWIGQICNVMGYLHMQSPMFIYRDVKPANFILEPSGRIRVVDFDIIRSYKPGRIEDTVNLGTKGYAAPEQFGGRGQTDPRTDVYGIGVTMYRLLTGADVQERNIILNPITLDEPGIPSGLAYIINKCTQFNPRERYNSCDELLNDLVRYNELPPKRGLFSRLKIR